MSIGPEETGMVAVTVFVLVVITEIVFEPVLVTYASVPAALIATAKGDVPTATVFTTKLVLVLITDTLLAPLLTT
jgi:hypothetical protein